MPVFTLQAQEGRLFAPLAFTKTYAMAGAAILSVTLVPVLMGYSDPRPHPGGDRQPPEPLAERPLPAGHRLGDPPAQAHPRRGRPGLRHHRLAADPPRRRVHAAMNEGDLLYMPSALPGLSIAKARSCSSRPTG